MITKYFRFGHTDLCIQMPEEMKIPANFEKFCVSNAAENAVRYTLSLVQNIAQAAAELLKRKMDCGCELIRENLHVFYINKENGFGSPGECRFIRFAGADKPYGISRQLDECCYEVLVDCSIREMLAFDTVFTSLFSLEKHVIQDGGLILHSAYMCWQKKAVLFSAPSGTGKSTQADLWEKYRHTYTVNGDRSLLIRDPDGWRAYGWPICGSSEICHNETHMIHCIVILKQAKENRIYRLKGLQALCPVMEQITINSWNRDFQVKAMDQLELLLQEIPVFCLECNISEAAVSCLEQAISDAEER